MPSNPHRSSSRPKRSRPASSPRSRRVPVPGSHAPIERIFRIHVLINEGACVTASRVADEFNVDVRTIQRDVAFMRRRLGIWIRYHRKWGSYYYERPCPHLPFFRLTTKDLNVLTVAGQRFAAWAGVSMAGLLRTVFKKFMAVSGGAVPLPSQANGADEPPFTEFALREQEHLAPVWEAVARRRELRLAYRKRDSKVIETRLIQPLHVDVPGRRWIVIAWDLERRDYRTFRLGRIYGVEPTGHKFKVPAGFDPVKVLAGNIGAYTGKEDHEVKFIARDNAAIFAEEEGFHRSQQLMLRPDGKVEVTLRVNNLIEIKYELLRWGPEVEVVSPAPLRAAMSEAHHAALAQYA